MVLGGWWYLLLYVLVVEWDGCVLLMIGILGVGKLMLVMLFVVRGWWFMGDEFVLFDFVMSLVYVFLWLISFKNEVIVVVVVVWLDVWMGLLMVGMLKGDICYMVFDVCVIVVMDVFVWFVLLLFL